ncbi:hypothetical protein EX30DRAFT_338858 [Ascodesmis nigricans]|uniref:IEC3 subunit of the Ino80 complex, chromatin re-modelling-domain-containing protein n=1 Tax=Ascodesmis nigricans TaxID=341454 RepID=A0A4S2N571_9PEZI|nr:hypothetical protein EX30DRAFT_338858 [Ascodesmis nigricans]
MSADHSHHHSAPTTGSAAHQKSFKRKYRKLRHKFKDVMKQSDELFRQEQLSASALRRMQEENTRILDLLVDLNEIGHMSKDLRFNIGSPSRATPPRFLSPTMLATITGGDLSLLQDPDDDVEEMDLDATGGAAVLAGMQSAGVTGIGADRKSNSSSSDDDSDDSDSDSDDGVTKPVNAGGQESNYNSDDDDDKEAYLEEIREWKYARGEPGTPPRKVREKMRAEAEQERKDAQEHAKKAAEEQASAAAAAAAAAAAGANEEDTNQVGTLPTNGTIDAPNTNGVAVAATVEDLRKSLNVESYRRGQTPDYLKDPSPFIMSLEEEEEWYNDIHNRYDGHIPPSQYPTSPSLKADGDPRNPMSVYCWLRKNQPQVFLQTDESGEKKPGGRGRGGGRRKAVEQPLDSDDGASTSAKVTLGKRRWNATANGEELGEPPSGTRGGRGGGRGGLSLRGGRRKQDGESPMKKQRR